MNSWEMRQVLFPIAASPDAAPGSPLSHCIYIILGITSLGIIGLVITALAIACVHLVA